jgi:hypothetical protein
MVTAAGSEDRPQESTPVLTPPPDLSVDWYVRVRRAIEARQAAERHWRGRNPVSRQTWPIRLHRG